jgi:hypothetical protein
LAAFSLISKGEVELATGGSYCGQMFGLLMGFGVGQLKNILMHGPQRFELFSGNDVESRVLLGAVLGFALLTFFFTWVYAVVGKGVLGKCFGWFNV